MIARREVQLHLLRHAHAGDPMKWQGPDEIRPLSAKGRGQAERLGALLAGAAFSPDIVLSSPMARALETAQLVAAPLGVNVATAEVLAGRLDLELLDSLLKEFGDPERPLLVGHDPDFSTIAADLVGVAELPLRKAALARIDVPRPLRPGAGILRWLVPPELLAPPD
jgi:phosphohistidine phosphatase